MKLDFVQIDFRRINLLAVTKSKLKNLPIYLFCLIIVTDSGFVPIDSCC